MIGYKAFYLVDNKLTASRGGFTFEIGKTYEEREAVICEKGFHYCLNVKDVFNYYEGNKGKPVVVCRITDLGSETKVQHDKSCTTKIRIECLLDGVYNGLKFVEGKLNGIIEYTDGTKCWYVNGQLHRDDDKPAIENSYGTREWYLNGQRHRDGDKPAVEFSNGRKEWFKNGHRHRDEDKPAIESSDGTKYWYKNGQLHRDGDTLRGEAKPAIEHTDGRKKWFENGQFIRAE